jgi:hypothetical protein
MLVMIPNASFVDVQKSIITNHSLRDCLTQGLEIKHGQQKVFHIFTKSKLKLVHERNFIL